MSSSSFPPYRKEPGDKYAQIAAQWGVDPDDPSIHLLKEFDQRFESLKTETTELKGEMGQWRNLTSELIGLVRDQNLELKTLSSNTEKLSTSSNTLSQELQTFDSQIESQNKILNPLAKDFKSLNTSAGEIATLFKPLPEALKAFKPMQQTLIEIGTATIDLSQAIPREIAILRGKRFWSGLLALVLLGMVIFIVVTEKQQLDLINRNLNSVLIRLDRLERR